MPIYEYKCGACEHRLESLQKFSDEPLRECPQCGEPALKKLISAVGFRLKGSGWYETDFKSGNRRNVVEAEKSESKSGDKAESKGGDKAESKSGDKAESKGADKGAKSEATTPKKEGKGESKSAKGDSSTAGAA